MFVYAEGESEQTVWPGGVPLDGTARGEVERFAYVWLWVISYVLNSVMIIAALICFVFTLVFRKRK